MRQYEILCANDAGRAPRKYPGAGITWEKKKTEDKGGCCDCQGMCLVSIDDSEGMCLVSIDDSEELPNSSMATAVDGTSQGKKKYHSCILKRHPFGTYFTL